MINSIDKAIFLDRDGVLNKLINVNGELTSPKIFSDFKIYHDELIKFKKLKSKYLLILITNQPDISRKKMKKNELDKMHKELSKHIDLDEILVCMHDNNDDCTCRKPKPGMLLDAKSRLKINFNKSYLIGDSWRDISAGKKVGVETILINRDAKNINNVLPDYCFDSLDSMFQSNIIK